MYKKTGGDKAKTALSPENMLIKEFFDFFKEARAFLIIG